MPVRFFFIMSTMTEGSVAMASCIDLDCGFWLNKPLSCGACQCAHEWGNRVIKQWPDSPPPPLSSQRKVQREFQPLSSQANLFCEVLLPHPV